MGKLLCLLDLEVKFEEVKINMEEETFSIGGFFLKADLFFFENRALETCMYSFQEFF